jgi:hypothetical protein
MDDSFIFVQCNTVPFKSFRTFRCTCSPMQPNALLLDICQFFCNCMKFCGGDPPKEVSQATYYRHAQARERDKFSPEFYAALRTQASGPSAANKRPRSNLTRVNVPASKHQRKHGDPSLDAGHNNGKVSSNSSYIIVFIYTQSFVAFA